MLALNSGSCLSWNTRVYYRAQVLHILLQMTSPPQTTNSVYKASTHDPYLHSHSRTHGGGAASPRLVGFTHSFKGLALPLKVCFLIVSLVTLFFIS